MQGFTLFMIYHQIQTSLLHVKNMLSGQTIIQRVRQAEAVSKQMRDYFLWEMWVYAFKSILMNEEEVNKQWIPEFNKKHLSISQLAVFPIIAWGPIIGLTLYLLSPFSSIENPKDETTTATEEVVAIITEPKLSDPIEKDTSPSDEFLKKLVRIECESTKKKAEKDLCEGWEKKVDGGFYVDVADEAAKMCKESRVGCRIAGIYNLYGLGKPKSIARAYYYLGPPCKEGSSIACQHFLYACLIPDFRADAISKKRATNEEILRSRFAASKEKSTNIWEMHCTQKSVTKAAGITCEAENEFCAEACKWGIQSACRRDKKIKKAQRAKLTKSGKKT